jgi:hypothetical protein
MTSWCLLHTDVNACAGAPCHLGGQRGIVLAILALMLLGVSSAGGAVTYQFEPGFYGGISQLLPPGAALTAVRNVEYFDWAATLAPLLVLGAFGRSAGCWSACSGSAMALTSGAARCR